MSWYARTADNRARDERGGLPSLRGVLSALLRWQELRRQRRRLLALDDRMLKDIGLSRADAHREGARPFWDEHGLDPGSWR